MSIRAHKYTVSGVDLSALRSRTETHVSECLRTVLEERGLTELDQEIIRDAYAYALNQLPTLYPGEDAAGPADPVRAWDIHNVVDQAIRYVMGNPKQ